MDFGLSITDKYMRVVLFFFGKLQFSFRQINIHERFEFCIGLMECLGKIFYIFIKDQQPLMNISILCFLLSEMWRYNLPCSLFLMSKKYVREPLVNWVVCISFRFMVSEISIISRVQAMVFFLLLSDKNTASSLAVVYMVRYR
jgi:hypothetical protein